MDQTKILKLLENNKAQIKYNISYSSIFQLISKETFNTVLFMEDVTRPHWQAESEHSIFNQSLENNTIDR